MSSLVIAVLALIGFLVVANIVLGRTAAAVGAQANAATPPQQVIALPPQQMVAAQQQQSLDAMYEAMLDSGVLIEPTCDAAPCPTAQAVIEQTTLFPGSYVSPAVTSGSRNKRYA